jgi:3'(2'), 5'-bisphosphate nucleotidase
MQRRTIEALRQEMDAASELAVHAGGILLQRYDHPAVVSWKGNAGPVTDADRLANTFLVRALRSRFPGDGVISEEEPDDPDRRRKARVWIIDPMDGTKEFIEHRGEFSVMIGLALEGTPVLGVVYHPVTGKLYRAIEGSGAVRVEGNQETPLRVSAETDPGRMTVALSRSHHSPSVDAVCGRVGIGNSIQSGSIGLKIGLICEGRAHLYLEMSGRTSEWDTCAPAALLQQAGGRITDLHGRPLWYNSADLRHCSGIIASNGTIHDRIVEAARYV